jgi:hypothetical protein
MGCQHARVLAVVLADRSQRTRSSIEQQLDQLPIEQLSLVSNFLNSINQDQPVIPEQLMNQMNDCSSEIQDQFPVNLLRSMKPYAYLADPNEPAIFPDDWEINQDFEENHRRSFLILIFEFGGITMIQD